MTPVPLPASPCIRVRLIYNDGDGQLAGNRLYFSYSGSAPSPANCVTLAGDVESAWASHIAGLCASGQYDLTEIDVLDIASDSGSSGQWTGSSGSTRSGTPLPLQCATNIEFNIARRYRGGKPRMYLPPGVTGDLATGGQYGGTFVSAVNTAVAAFISEIEALSIGSMGTLQHVNLSYYSGVYTTTPPWRGPGFKYPPKYRSEALLDTVEGYACKTEVGSQRRRRTATSS
jgi:hypothetical protein